MDRGSSDHQEFAAGADDFSVTVRRSEVQHLIAVQMIQSLSAHQPDEGTPPDLIG